MGSKNKAYAIGVCMVVAGGAGLAEISTSNHGCFWLCATLFALGIGLCIWSYGQ